MDGSCETHDGQQGLFTGKGSEGIAARAIDAGGSRTLQKESGLDHYAVLANRIRSLVSEHRAAQRVRRSVEALEATRDGIAVFRDDGVFQYVNEAYAGFYGYTPSDLAGGGWEHLYTDAELERYAERVVPTLERDGAWSGECECVHRDGSVFTSTHSISQMAAGGHVCVIPFDSLSDR